MTAWMPNTYSDCRGWCQRINLQSSLRHCAKSTLGAWNQHRLCPFCEPDVELLGTNIRSWRPHHLCLDAQRGDAPELASRRISLRWIKDVLPTVYKGLRHRQPRYQSKFFDDEHDDEVLVVYDEDQDDVAVIEEEPPAPVEDEEEPVDLDDDADEEERRMRAIIDDLFEEESSGGEENAMETIK